MGFVPQTGVVLDDLSEKLTDESLNYIVSSAFSLPNSNFPQNATWRIIKKLRL